MPTRLPRRGALLGAGGADGRVLGVTGQLRARSAGLNRAALDSLMQVAACLPEGRTQWRPRWLLTTGGGRTRKGGPGASLFQDKSVRRGLTSASRTAGPLAGRLSDVLPTCPRLCEATPPAACLPGGTE